MAAAMDGLKLDPMLAPERASGGERRRAALAKLIAEAPELMLLDEPTNHLDVQAIAWLEAHLARDADGLRGGQPRPGVPEGADRPHALGRPRRGAAAGARLRGLRGVARQGLRGGGRGAAQARPLHQGRGALGGRGDLGAAQAQHGAGAAAGRAARRAAGADRAGRGRRGWRSRAAPPSGELVVEAEQVAQALRRADDPARLLGPDRARRAGGAGRAERGRQDDAARTS